MKKILAIIMLTALLIGIISAEETTVTSSDNYNFFTDLFHRIEKIGLFTAEGQSRECSTNSDWTVNPAIAGTVYSKSQLLSRCDGPSALIDIFDTSYHFLQEYRYENIGSSFQINPSANRIMEVYCCPYKPCNSNSGCSSSPASNYGNACNTNYGSCYTSIPTYTTQIYKCSNGDWLSSGTASYGQSHFCSTQGNNNYIDETGNEHCASSPSTSWCSKITPCDTMSGTSGKCESNYIGDKKCIGNSTYYCTDYSISGKCWANAMDCTTSGKVCSNGECIIAVICITRADLSNYINQWISNLITRNDLGQKIQQWAGGNC
jgi:hypothetical protein